uniref:Receptor activity-modifying protein 3 n=1 Tax=Cyprinus carpio carpio TaxID=630221 RepID=A0A9J8CKZ9_CYPCA
MDPNLLTLFKLSLILAVNTLMTRGLSDADGVDQSFTQQPWLLQCNQTVLLLEMERCGEQFSSDMNHVHPEDREYHVFSSCTEKNAERIGCFWPNPAVERFIISIHKHFFSNCSLDHAVFIDPPDDTLILLIFIPVFLTLAMVVLVVWCSKRSDILA